MLAHLSNRSEIASAMQRSSVSAQLAGISMQELASYVSVISSVTRQSAESIGESFKTIFARMQQVKLGAAFDEEGESLSNVDKVLKQYNISLRDAKGNFRDMSDVLNELGARWNQFDTIQKSEIATTIAGIRQRERFLVLMENYDKVLEAQTIATNSAGLSQERYGIYLESVEAKMNKFTATWEEMWSKTLNSDLIKFFIDLGTTILGLINDLGGLIPILTAIISLIVIMKAELIATSIAGFFSTMIAGWTSVVAAIGSATVAVTSFGTALTMSLGALGLVIAAATILANLLPIVVQELSKVELTDSIAKKMNLKNSFGEDIKQGMEELVSAAKRAQKEFNALKFIVDVPSLDAFLEKYKELKDTLDETLGSVVSTADGVAGLIKEYDELGYVTLNQVETLRQMFPEDYMQALIFEGDQIRLNTDKVKELTVAKALEAVESARATKQKLVDEQTVAQQALLSAQAVLESAKVIIFTNDELGASYNRLAAAAAQAAAAQGVVTSINEKITAINNEIKTAEEYYNQLQNGTYWTNAFADATSGAAGSVNALNDAQQAYDAILRMTISMLRQEKEEEKERLQDTLDAYKKIIDAKKEELEITKERDEYNKKVEDKNKEIADIDRELFEMQFDNSEEANRRRLELEEERAKATEDLNEIQSDREYDLQNDALDKEYERFKEGIDAKIELIDEYLSKSGLIAQEAMALLAQHSASLYQSLIQWNRLYGDGIDATVDKLWNQYQALESLAGAGSGAAGSGGGTFQQDNPPVIPPSGSQPGGGGGGSRPVMMMHSGGIVGGLPHIEESEQFAKLLKGEVVANDSQMRNFMRNTLPAMTGIANDSSVGDVNLTIQVAGSLDKSVVPNIKNAVFEALNDALKQRGKKTNAFNYSV